MTGRIMVTGVNGFVGKHLARELDGRGVETDGVIRENSLHPEIKSLIKKTISCDLVDKDSVEAIDFSAYSAVIHLAGLAKVGASFENPDLYTRVNVQPLVNICEALFKQKASPRIIAISTGAVYDAQQPMPLSEESRTNPNSSPYVASKLEMEDKAGEYGKRGLEVVIVRPFNHIGPEQESGFLVPDLYEKIRQAKTEGKPVKVGNLDTRRDYTDVRDVAKAYASIALQPELKSEIYNICSGVSVPGRQILEMVAEAMGEHDLATEVDQSLIRPNDPNEIYGSYERLRSQTGWQPSIPLKKTLADFVSSRS